ncbi:MAG: GDP-mannose 4,6-dehydratase [Gammaproteobacteria bacterium]|nr:GDP-mannose 4,6-dehydratase [Gammaproteobacteria bacterium]
MRAISSPSDDVLDHPRHVFERVDIRDRPALDRVFREYRPSAVLHLPAESPAPTQSIEGPGVSIETQRHRHPQSAGDRA